MDTSNKDDSGVVDLNVGGVDLNVGVVDLNVGGVYYTTKISTLKRYPKSKLAEMFSTPENIADLPSHKGRYFIDRDGVLFRYILDFLRDEKLQLPENFLELSRLNHEAEHYKIPFSPILCHRLLSPQCSLLTEDDQRSPDSPLFASPNNPIKRVSSGRLSVGGKNEPGCVTVGYRGTFSFGRDGGVADVKFRKLLRILVAGRVSLCREVFGETLNESRDPDRGGNDRYTSRFFLKHVFLEQAFDMLHDAGFRMVGSCGSGTNSLLSGDSKPCADSPEESKWLHYNEFVFYRSNVA